LIKETRFLPETGFLSFISGSIYNLKDIIRDIWDCEQVFLGAGFCFFFAANKI